MNKKDYKLLEILSEKLDFTELPSKYRNQIEDSITLAIDPNCMEDYGNFFDRDLRIFYFDKDETVKTICKHLGIPFSPLDDKTLEYLEKCRFEENGEIYSLTDICWQLSLPENPDKSQILVTENVLEAMGINIDTHSQPSSKVELTGEEQAARYQKWFVETYLAFNPD